MRIFCAVLLVGSVIGTKIAKDDAIASAKHRDVVVWLPSKVIILEPIVIAATVLGIVFAHGWRRWLTRQAPGERSKLNLYGWLFFGLWFVVGLVQYANFKDTIASYGY